MDSTLIFWQLLLTYPFSSIIFFHKYPLNKNNKIKNIIQSFYKYLNNMPVRVILQHFLFLISFQFQFFLGYFYSNYIEFFQLLGYHHLSFQSFSEKFDYLILHKIPFFIFSYLLLSYISQLSRKYCLKFLQYEYYCDFIKLIAFQSEFQD